MPIEISPNPGGEYIEVVAQTDVVDKNFLSEVVETVAKELAETQVPPFRILLVVEAATSKMTVFDSYEVWERALEKGLRRAKVGYVVTGRPVSTHARLVQSIAQRRRISLRFFDNRARAIEWLTDETEPQNRIDTGI